MTVIQKNIKDIKPYDKNPRKNDNAVDAVANSIHEFGFRQPIVIDSNNIIVAGHTRYRAAKKLKLEEIPCVMADDLSDEQIRAYRLADNKTSELATWDFELLDAELNDILNFEMVDFGFADAITHDMDSNKSGASPWDRMNSEAGKGVLFSFGEITCRINDETYEAFIASLADEEVTSWLARRL